MAANDWTYRVEGDEQLKNMEPTETALRQLAKVMLAAMIEEGILKAPNKKEVK